MSFIFYPNYAKEILIKMDNFIPCTMPYKYLKPDKINILNEN